MRFVYQGWRKTQSRLWCTNTDIDPFGALLGARRPSQTKPCPTVHQRINLVSQPRESRPRARVCACVCLYARERERWRENPFGKSRKGDVGGDLGKFARWKRRKGESADTKMALCSLHRRRDAREGGDGAEEGLNVGGWHRAGNGCVSRSKFRGKNVFRGECNLFIPLLLYWRRELKGYAEVEG